MPTTRRRPRGSPRPGRSNPRRPTPPRRRSRVRLLLLRLCLRLLLGSSPGPSPHPDPSPRSLPRPRLSSGPGRPSKPPHHRRHPLRLRPIRIRRVRRPRSDPGLTRRRSLRLPRRRWIPREPRRESRPAATRRVRHFRPRPLETSPTSRSLRPRRSRTRPTSRHLGFHLPRTRAAQRCRRRARLARR